MELKSSQVSSVKIFGFDMPQSSRSRGMIRRYFQLTPLPSWMRTRGSRPARASPGWRHSSELSMLMISDKSICTALRLVSGRGGVGARRWFNDRKVTGRQVFVNEIGTTYNKLLFTSCRKLLSHSRQMKVLAVVLPSALAVVDLKAWTAGETLFEAVTSSTVHLRFTGTKWGLSAHRNLVIFARAIAALSKKMLCRISLPLFQDLRTKANPTIHNGFAHLIRGLLLDGAFFETHVLFPLLFSFWSGSFGTGAAVSYITSVPASIVRPQNPRNSKISSPIPVRLTAILQSPRGPGLSATLCLETRIHLIATNLALEDFTEAILTQRWSLSKPAILVST